MAYLGGIIGSVKLVTGSLTNYFLYDSFQKELFFHAYQTESPTQTQKSELMAKVSQKGVFDLHENMKELKQDLVLKV